MIERPILFSAPMARAILEGHKTQTRRIVKGVEGLEFLGWCTDTTGDQRNIGAAGFVKPPMDANPTTFARNRYGQPGDQLWVRESFSFHETPSDPYFLSPDAPGEALGIHYWADGNPEWGNWDKPKPSIHMPRRASRISLELTGVRIERLHAITEADAKAEGVETDEFMEFMDWAHSVAPIGVSCEFPTLRGEFQKLWEKINGTDSWDANPWVWVIEFKRVKP